MLRINPPDCSLMDLNSSNGTSVNNTFYCLLKEKTRKGFTWKPPCEVRVRDGDRVIAGLSHFRIGVLYDLVCKHCNMKFVVHGDSELQSMGAAPLCEDCRSVVSPGKETTAHPVRPVRHRGDLRGRPPRHERRRRVCLPAMP